MPVVDRGLALLARHRLRAAAAARIAAAMLVADGARATVTFVCLDRRLADAAQREGLSTLTWPADWALQAGDRHRRRDPRGM